MYVGASLWVNSEMGTSLFHTCQYFLPLGVSEALPGCM